MTDIQRLLAALDEREIAANVTSKHDEARLQYRLEKNTVSDFREFEEKIADYYDYHFRIASNGGYVDKGTCRSRAKNVIERHYHRQGGDIRAACRDAQDGTNGGLRSIIDLLADSFKEQSQIEYVTDIFDRFVAPNSFEEKTEIIRQFIKAIRPTSGSAIDVDHPERYAENYKDLIQGYVDALTRAHRSMRRL